MVKKLKNKKGFTLIEIIVAIVLIGIVGTTSVVSINKANEKKEYKKLEKMNNNLTTALEVYLANHSEIEENLMLNAKAAVVTLENLKNEGLIEEGLVNPVNDEKLDYKGNYFMLLEGEVVENSEFSGNTDCQHNQIGINVINSWDLSKYDDSNVIYVCPRKDYSAEINALKTSVADLASEIDTIKSKINGIEGSNESTKDKLKIDSLYSELTYTAKGVNPNNYVVFEVNSDSTKLSYFPNNQDKDLWRILSIDETGKIKLFYPQAVKSNNFSNYTSESSTWCDAWITDDKSSCTFYKLKHYAEGSDVYYKYDSNDGFAYSEVMEDVTVSSSKKEALYNSIVNKNWIIMNKYFPYYTVPKSGENTATHNTASSINMKMGLLSYSEITSSVNISDSWLYSFNTTLGPTSINANFETHYLTVYNSSGILKYIRGKYMANRCTNNSCSKDKDSSSHWYLKTYQYNPVVTLDSKVELVEQSCNGSVIGSKECPYKLICNDC